MLNPKGHTGAALFLLAACACLLLSAAGASALNVRTPWPLHSYFEGLRGRLPLSTPATTDDPLAVWINPAGLGTGKSGGFTYLHTYSDSSFDGDNAFAIALGSIGFGAEFTRMRATHRYTIASGQELFQGLYLGTSYSWFTSHVSEIDRASTWSLGVLVRPNRMLSLGLLARDLNSPTYYGNKFRPIYETSLGFRPAGDRLTIFANYLAREKDLSIRTPGEGMITQTQPKSFFTYGAEAEIVRGLVVKVGADEDDNVSVSVSLLAGNGGIGSLFTSRKADEKDEATYGTAFLTASPFWHDNFLMPENGYLEIDLNGSIGETQPPFSIIGRRAHEHTLQDLLDKIERAKRTPEIRGMVLRCTGISSNFAIYDELRGAIKDFRATGKRVLAYTETPGNGEYYLASACDYVVMEPSGYLGLVGLKAEIPFVRGTLEKLGVKAEYNRVGRYKSAVEELTEDQYTEPSLEAENALLDDTYAKLVADIAEGRAMTQDQARAAIDSGPYVPEDAVKAGLVDTVAYWDMVPDIARKLLAAGSRKISYESFARRNYQSARWDQPPSIGIVYAVGSISHGKNRRDVLFGETMGSDTITEAIRSMRKDPSVKAVVLRVDSPGGVMSASDLIRREVEVTRKVKPVIVSMGRVAASGGYHISCGATKILADEATVTGSIGVFNLWFHTRGLYEKLGANKEILVRGKHADAMPTWRDVTPEDMELLQQMVDEFYRRFVDAVAEGRGMTYDAVDQIAQGRVWSGRAALGNGLVDRIGGLTAAITLAKQEAGIAPEAEVNFRILPKSGGLLGAVMSNAQARLGGRIEIPGEVGDLIEQSIGPAQFDEPFLYLMPGAIEIE